MKKISAKIFGDEYIFTGELEEKHVIELAKTVDRKMKEISSNFQNINKLKVAVLAALNFADELVQLKTRVEDLPLGQSELGLLEARTKKMLSLLDDGLIGENS